MTDFQTVYAGHALRKRGGRPRHLPDKRDEGLKRAMAAVHGPTQLARLLGLARQAVGGWKSVPTTRIKQVEQLTGVPRNVLRPDLYE